MKVIIAGSRDIHDYALLERAILASRFVITEVLSGAQRGVDWMGEKWSLDMLGKKATRYAPKNHTEQAYRDRNLEMAKASDALIAIPGPHRPSGVDGTRNIITHARAHGLKVFVPEMEE